ncbi:MAG: DMT family transporter [Litorimonas sp.]
MKTHFRQVTAAPYLDDKAADIEGGAGAWLGIIFGALGAALFSLKAVLAKLAFLPVDGLASNELPVITLVTLRMVFAFPFYAGILWWTLRRGAVRPTMRQVILSMAAGTMSYYGCALLDFSGLQYITAQLERLLLFTYPAFVILFGALFFGGKITRFGLAAMALAYGGLAIVFAGGEITQSTNLWLGSGLIIACAILFAIFQLIAKQFIDKIGPSLFTCLAMVGGATAIFMHFTIAALNADGLVQAFQVPMRIYVIAAIIAVFSTVLPSFLVNYALGKIGAQKVAMLGMIGPLATVIAAIYILDEPFGIWDGIGMVVTFSGITLYLLADKFKRNRR